MAHDTGDIVPMTIERLPDLNVPRSAHALVVSNGELTVIGGHTTAFVLTNTAEYYKDGRWHLVETHYPHDFGACAMLPSGEVIVAGGCFESFGIDRSFGVESYDPVSHSFFPLPILDQRRARCTMALQSDSTLLVSGNWHDDDAIGIYTQGEGGHLLREVSQGRANPYILQTAADNAFIFGATGNLSSRNQLDTILIDQLKGEPFQHPLLQEWKPVGRESSFCMRDLFVGDVALGGYAWLVPACRNDGQAAVLKLVGESFSLLETERPVPMRGMAGDSLRWTSLLVDRAAENAYLISDPQPSGHIYVCKLGYGEALRGGEAPLTLYAAKVWEHKNESIVVPVLLPGGRIAFAGGYDEDNYYPNADAFILHTEPLPAKRAWVWWTVALLVLLCAGAAAGLMFWRRKKEDLPPAGEHLEEIGQRLAQVSDMMSRIQVLMEEQELFKKTDVKVDNIADALGTNATYVRQCIASAYGSSFKNYVNEYRVRYVQQHLKEHPDAKINALALDAGFSSSATFYRNFTAVTGLSPAAWLKQEQEHERESAR